MFAEVTMSTTEATPAPATSLKRDASSLDDQQHFWDLIKDFSEVFFLSRAADGNEHGRPMHIVKVCFGVMSSDVFEMCGANSE